MTQNRQSDPHTAISTWSGFVYQGKLALYHCLRLMTNDYGANRDLKLQLESQDDFAIFRGNQCLSLHQVKAYKTTLFSGYRAGINSQKENATERGIQTAYFHVAREITDLPESFEQDYQPVELYSYPLQPGENEEQTKLYCPLDEVDRYIEAQIREMISVVDCLFSWKANLCTSIREILEAIVNTKVVMVHHQIHLSNRNQTAIAAHQFIEFSDIYEILEADDYERFNNEEYFLSRLQIDIGAYYQEFCEQHDTLPQAAYAKLDDCIATITDLDSQGMKGFLRATMPHRKGRFTTLSEFKDQTLDRDSMRQGLFTIFHKLVKAQKLDSERVHFAWEVDGRFYYPTGIHTAAEHQDVVCHDILQQALEEDVECLFECGALITSAIDMPSITCVKIGVDATEEETIIGTSIGSFQQVGLVSLNNVPESLKDAEVD